MDADAADADAAQRRCHADQLAHPHAHLLAEPWEDNESPAFQYKTNSSEYATSLLRAKAVEWIGRDNVTGAQAGGRPFFVYFAPHCPHTTSTPEHKYEDACAGVISPRTPSYNHTNEGFHELVRSQPPLTSSDAILIDDLARRRCQCLMSVDDAHASLVASVQKAGRWEQTYWMVSSDHGYNLGQQRIPSNTDPVQHGDHPRAGHPAR